MSPANDHAERPSAESQTLAARRAERFDRAPVGLVVVDGRGVIVDANAAALAMLDRDALEGRRFTDLVLPADRESVMVERLTSMLQPVEVRLTRGGAESAEFWAELDVAVERGGDGRVSVHVAMRDVSARKARDLRLEQAAAMFECAGEGVMVTGVDARILLVNKAFTELTGYREDEVLGQTPHVLGAGRQDREFYSSMWSQLERTGAWKGELWNRRKSGEVFPELLTITAVRDGSGAVSRYVGVFSDISELKRSAAQLDFLAHHDPLTGLPNRLVLLERLARGIDASTRARDAMALVLLDLDRFKDVNDSFGHPAGDELLQQVARRLTSRLRGVDTVSRLGGDEFAILLQRLARPEDAGVVARKIIDALSDPWKLSSGPEVRIGASVGISLFPAHGATSEELMEHADAALYRAKSEGRGRFCYFSSDLTVLATRRLELEARLRGAVERRELTLHYQPQVEVATGRIVGAEALLRWRHPVEGLITPEHFIALAEETGLLESISRWVLHEACTQGRRWSDLGLGPLRIAVNLSPRQLRHGEVAATVRDLLAETGMPPEHLELEVTEGALIAHEPEATATLRGLRDLGVRLALDDFGAGYISIAHLKRLPLSALKIDRAFVREISTHGGGGEVVAALVAMGQALGLEVLAEGVERPEELAFLRARGCALYQGFLTSPAVPPEEFEALMRERAATRA